jgi:methylated-DNA-[protein]-cysteine S-methyltransferase
MSSEQFSDVVDTPIGPITIVCSSAGVRALSWGKETAENGLLFGAIRRPSHPMIAAARGQLKEYFLGDRREFDLPLDVVGSEFQKKVWKVLSTIPYGETISYQEQARRVGDTKKARAVGAANGRNPVGIIVPCHRVIGKNGKLVGFAAGIETKRFLLRHEQGASSKYSNPSDSIEVLGRNNSASFARNDRRLLGNRNRSE